MLSNNIICITEKCPHRKVCKHYEYLKNLDEVTATIDSCDHLPKLTVATTITTPVDKASKISPYDPINVPLGTKPYITEPNTIKTPDYPFKTYPYNNRPQDYYDRDNVTCYSYTGDNIAQNFAPLKPLNNAPLNVTPVKIAKGICSICGKEAYTENCSDCGNVICHECGYTNVDVNNGIPIITCDKCFGASDKNECTETSIKWDINDFSEEVKEETKDEQPKESKTRKKPSSNKSNK